MSLTQAIDAAGQRTQLKTPIGFKLNFKNDYAFDTLGRLTSIVQQAQAGGNSVTAKHFLFDYNARY